MEGHWVSPASLLVESYGGFRQGTGKGANSTLCSNHAPGRCSSEELPLRARRGCSWDLGTAVSLPQKPVCTVPMEAPSGWSVGSALHSCAQGCQCGSWWEGWREYKQEGSVTTRAWSSPWQPRSCVSETDCWGGLADGHQLFRREVPLPFHLKVTCGCLFAWLLQPPPPLSNVWSCLKYFPKPFLHLPGHLPLLSGRTLWQKGMIWGTKGQQWTRLATAAPQVNMPVGCLSEIFPELFSLGVWIFKLAFRRGEVLSKQPL